MHFTTRADAGFVEELIILLNKDLNPGRNFISCLKNIT